MAASETRLDDGLAEALVRTRRYFTRGTVSDDLRTLHHQGGRDADAFYRDRWSHDKVVRSTHGVNCTGSCSWKVYVKDGIITWETQQTDYPSTGPDRPEYEPRGCPRGAAFSWYTYSPTRVRYPYVRGALLQMYREAKSQHGDSVAAWAHVVDHPDRAKHYKSQRGKGGMVRATWEEAVEIVAAAYVHTIRKWGPDRVAGFSPIPAMSMVSHASGARFTSLVGGSMLSFYDWYADLPVASPQVFGDQTDVPESGDWWDAGYLIMWGSNLPVTRTPDAHWMAEARYRGQKVVAVAPDYADNVKFADEWLPARPGTDGALALAMGQVILQEFFVERSTPYFTDYVKRYSDLPFLVKVEDGRPGKFLTADDLGSTEPGTENAAFKTVLLDARTGEPVVPNGTLGDRFGEQGAGRWNLDLGDVDPVLALEDGEEVTVTLPAFGDVDGSPQETTATVRARRVDGHLVTTVYELMLARYAGYTPEWQEPVTGVPAAAARRIAREFARNAEESRGRSMIIMGAGTNHWFHSDTIYRAFLALTTLTGCQGVNGGGWAHYVGQEKCRPVTGWAQLASALDWSRPPRQMIQTAYWYLHTDQFRYDPFGADALSSTRSDGRFAGMTTADLIAQSARMGWMPSYPTFDRNPLDLTDEAAAAGKPVAEHVVEELESGRLRFACEDPDSPENFPRVLSIWRANLLGSSAKGNEYFLEHLLGTDSSLRAEEAGEGMRPRDVVWHDEAPVGKLDLLLSLDFRQTSTTLFSDVVLPAATWYEKHDLNTTDMHPFVHSFNPAIAPPWQTRTDWDAWQAIAKRFSELAENHLGTRRDVVAVPLLHDTPDELANPARRRPRLEARRVPARAGQDDAQAGRGRARLRRGRRAHGRARTPARHARHDDQGRHLRRHGCDRLPARQERRRARRTGRRTAVAGARRARLRGDPRALRHHQRPPRRAGLQDPGEAHRHGDARPRRRARGQADHLRRHPGRARPGHHLTGVVGLGERWPALQPVHDQRGAAQALAHADRAAALLPRPRLDAGAGRGAAGLPAAARHGDAVRRTGARHGRRGGRRPDGDGPLPDAPQQVVDPLGVPGQPVHALAVARRAADLDERGRRRQGRHRRQRLDRGGQPQRRRRGARGGEPPDARGHRLHAPRPGPPDRRPAGRDLRQARRHPQLAHAAAGQAQPPRRRLCPAVVRVQLPRSHRQPARRGHRDPPSLPGGALLMRVMAQMAMVMNLDKCIGCHTCSVTCKQAWTNRAGTEYVWFNNVETRPGQGYPRTYEDQEEWKGGWTLTKKGRLTLKSGSRWRKLASIFSNPKLPSIQDYYEPWTYDYATLTDAPAQQHTPVARPKSLLSGEDMKIEWSANWDDNLGGSEATYAKDPILQKVSTEVKRSFEETFMFYLPRICEHCLNPSCAASCPSGAIYKRSEDGIVLVDQDRCRGWRMCVSGCPYKKVYFNHRTGKAEKCTFCFPRVEVGLPTVCSETCVGRLRYIGLVLYDADKVLEAASVTDDQALYEAQLEVFLDPDDPQVQREAERAGIPHDWMEAARRSPIRKLICDWKVALPLHPEYRTMPMVWYVPPLSPVVDVVRETGEDAEDARNLFAAVDALRIPVEYLAELFTAGDVAPVDRVLRKLAAMRSYMRDLNLGREADASIPAAVGMSEEEMYDMYRLLALAKYDERYVIPPAHAEQAHGLEELATECSLDYEGGPGMMESGPFGEGSGNQAQPIAVENFAMLQTRQTSDTIASPDGKERRVNLLNWDGKGAPPGLFPPPREEDS